MRGTGSRLVAAIVTPKPMAASRGSLGERDLEPRPSTIIKWTGPRPSLAPTCASADQCPAPCGRVARVRWAHAAGREDLFRLGCQGKPPPPRFSRKFYSLTLSPAAQPNRLNSPRRLSIKPSALSTLLPSIPNSQQPKQIDPVRVAAVSIRGLWPAAAEAGRSVRRTWRTHACCRLSSSTASRAWTWAR